MNGSVAKHANGGACRVTIVMSARERHALTEASISSIVAETSGPYRFVYLDVDSPAWLREVFAAKASAWGLDCVRLEGPLWPQEARQRIVGALATEYVVFIDNDVVVEEGWLDALVRCADESGAGIVGPLYLVGDGILAPSIHMAGGQLVDAVDDGCRLLEESHLHAGADPRTVSLARQPCDFLEFHCMLFRTQLLQEHGVLDPRLHCVHEHIDTALSVKARGHAVMMEPAARVTYLGQAEFMLEELPYFRSRWSAQKAQADIAYFSDKWNVPDTMRTFGGVRNFLYQHRAEVDPIRTDSLARPELATEMRAEELPQTRSALLDLAVRMGLTEDERALLANAYQVAHVLVDGGYRPCGRPFINHLVGTAGVLIRYGFRVESAAAGMLHAAYTHSPAHPRGPAAAYDAVRAVLGGAGSPLETRVRRYTLDDAASAKAMDAPVDLSCVSVNDAEQDTIVAANELDLHLSGEFRYSARQDGISNAKMHRIGQVCAVLGVPGLHASLVRTRAGHAPAPARYVTRIPGSYRIGPDRNSATPMVVNALDALRAS